MDSLITIQAVNRTNFDGLLPLIAAYQEFYGITPNTARNREHFGGLIDHPTEGCQWLALDNECQAVGFATLYFTKSTLSAGTSCVLNDLYTKPERRGNGIAQALIAACSSYAASRGYDSMEWVTQKSNTAAQKLYDKLGTGKSEWFHYSLKTR